MIDVVDVRSAHSTEPTSADFTLLSWQWLEACLLQFSEPNLQPAKHVLLPDYPIEVSLLLLGVHGTLTWHYLALIDSEPCFNSHISLLIVEARSIHFNAAS